MDGQDVDPTNVRQTSSPLISILDGQETVVQIQSTSEFILLPFLCHRLWISDQAYRMMISLGT